MSDQIICTKGGYMICYLFIIYFFVKAKNALK